MEKCQINTSTPGGHTNASLHGILQWKISTKVDPVGVEDCHEVSIRTRAVGVFLLYLRLRSRVLCLCNDLGQLQLIVVRGNSK